MQQKLLIQFSVASIRSEPVWIEVINKTVNKSSFTFPRLLLCPRVSSSSSSFNISVNVENIEILHPKRTVIASEYVLLSNLWKRPGFWSNDIQLTTSFANWRSCFWPDQDRPAPNRYVQCAEK